MIEILSLSLSHLDAFSPNAFAHHLHAVLCFISLIVSAVVPLSIDPYKPTYKHLLIYVQVVEDKW
jgi:hypothetical protein